MVEWRDHDQRLVAGQSYQVRARQRNSVGWGGYTTRSITVPAIVPGAPNLALSVSGTTISAVVSTTSTGGSSITETDIDYKRSSSTTWLSGGTTISGLSRGQSYQVRARQRNSAGWGGYTTRSITVPATVPGARELRVGDSMRRILMVASTSTRFM